MTACQGSVIRRPNGANESAVPAFAILAAVKPHLTQVSFIGGVRNAGDTWWQGWTCGLTAATPF